MTSSSRANSFLVISISVLAHHLAGDGLFLKHIISVVGFVLGIHKPLHLFKGADGTLSRQGMGSKIKNYLCQVGHQSNCFPSYILKAETQVVLNYLLTRIAKSFWHMQWKRCGLFFDLECLPSLLISTHWYSRGWCSDNILQKGWLFLALKGLFQPD